MLSGQGGTPNCHGVTPTPHSCSSRLLHWGTVFAAIAEAPSPPHLLQCLFGVGPRPGKTLWAGGPGSCPEYELVSRVNKPGALPLTLCFPCSLFPQVWGLGCVCV